MRIIQELWEMTETARGWLSGGAVALIPTAGNIHAGHLALVQTARRECEICVVSIFADPGQFPSPEAFARYSYDSERDLRLLERMGVDVVFRPELPAMYPAGFATHVVPGEPLADCFEARLYPRRLRAIATTTCKLLLLVRPDIAYFLQNDVYTVAVARRLVRDLNIDVSISVVPEMRDSDGLTFSESYELLSPEERQLAKGLYNALLVGLGLLLAGERRPEIITRTVARRIATEPQLTLEYVTLCDPETLTDLPALQNRALLVAAVKTATSRLIDGLLWQDDAG
jgi:pantoate--beta-alanine ligase